MHGPFDYIMIQPNLTFTLNMNGTSLYIPPVNSGVQTHYVSLVALHQVFSRLYSSMPAEFGFEDHMWQICTSHLLWGYSAEVGCGRGKIQRSCCTHAQRPELWALWRIGQNSLIVRDLEESCSSYSNAGAPRACTMSKRYEYEVMIRMHLSYATMVACWLAADCIL